MTTAGDPGQVGENLLVVVILPVGDQGDDKADQDLVGQAQGVEPVGGHFAIAGDQEKSCRGRDGAQVDQPK